MTRQAGPTELSGDPAGAVLPADLLRRCAERACANDPDRWLLREDLDDLKASGYALGPLPEEWGGRGLTLPEMCAAQRRLAYHAAPSAIAIQPHLTWLGTAADLRRGGDGSLEWVLRAAETGAVFSAGHVEVESDVPLCYSTTTAERVDGGYRFTGRKVCGATPPWTYLGVQGMDFAKPGTPEVVHAFLPREADGYRVMSARDDGTGGEAMQPGDEVVLQNAFVADRHVARIVPAGFHGLDPFVFAIFAWTLLGEANVYPWSRPTQVQ